MKGISDAFTLFGLVIGVLILLIGKINYKSQKEKFDVRYFRYAFGLSWILSELARIFIGTNNTYWVTISLVIFLIFYILSYIRKKHTS